MPGPGGPLQLSYGGRPNGGPRGGGPLIPGGGPLIPGGGPRIPGGPRKRGGPRNGPLENVKCTS